MAEHSQTKAGPSFQLCLDDEQICPDGPVPVTISSVSGSGLAVLMIKQHPGGVNAADLSLHGGEGRPLRLTARIGQRTVAVTAQLVWSEVGGDASSEIELIVDGAAASDWPAVIAAYRGVA